MIAVLFSRQNWLALGCEKGRETVEKLGLSVSFSFSTSKKVDLDRERWRSEFG